MRTPIVVNAPSFSETRGGVIALHYLVDRLRKLGHEAYLYPFYTLDTPPTGAARNPVSRLRVAVRNFFRVVRKKTLFRTHPSMDTPIAPESILRGAVVVYPEIVSGNPLGARHVVRWLLHQKGFLAADAAFGKDELTFHYMEAFRAEGADPDNLLRLRWIRDDVYFDTGNANRNGNCRLIRKGARAGTVANPDPDAILVDDLSHEQKARVFNRCRLFYSHDPYTMYLYYAARCGCIPVVIPQPGMSRDAWRPREEERWGIAYGDGEIDWAVRTHGLMLERFERERREGEDSVRRFVRKLEQRFDPAAGQGP